MNCVARCPRKPQALRKQSFADSIEDKIIKKQNE